jgi:hypothetical protein
MTFATYVMIFGQEKWAMRNLENAYPHVDQIYVCYPKYPWNYNLEAKEKYTNTFDLNIIKSSKYIDKITIIEGEWENQLLQRTECMQRAKKDGIDYLMYQDADEFYFHQHFEAIKNAIRNNPNYDAYERYLCAFWKSFKYIIINHDQSTVTGMTQTIFNLHKELKFGYGYNGYGIDSSNRAVINDIRCYHGSYVLSDEEMLKKIETWGHTNDFDRKKWYNEVWLPWTLESRNLHPIWPWVWPRCEIFNEELPEVIRDLK